LLRYSLNTDEALEGDNRQQMSLDAKAVAKMTKLGRLQHYSSLERLHMTVDLVPSTNYPKEILNFVNTVPGVRTNSQVVIRKEDPELFYRIIRAIKANSVYLAEELQTCSRRVLKKVYCYSSRGNAVAEAEAKLAQSMVHPNIVRTLDLFKYNKTIWVVLELMDLSAYELLQHAEKLPEAVIAHTLKEVCLGVAYLHSKGVMHRDIKSENILLSLDGEVKLTDFSYAAELTSETRDTFVGSPGWLAPEMLGGMHDLKVDVWSLGVLGVELADKHLPFVSQRPLYTVYCVISNPVPSLAEPEAWSDSFNNFLSKCLQKRPKQRPNITELLHHPFLSQTDPRSLYRYLETSGIEPN
jgi:p21-activated kinase 1